MLFMPFTCEWWGFVNKRFTHFNDYIGSSGDTICEWPVIALSISALGWTLEVAAHELYSATKPSVDGPEKWGSVGVLEIRLLKAGWSRSEIANYARHFCVDGLCYFRYLESPRKHQHYQNCLDPKCTRKRLTDDGYDTQHTEYRAKDCQICDEVLEIVRNGKTPLVAWKYSKLTVLESDLTNVYLAISQVWSDGMGNPTQTALSACQLSQIQEFVNKLYSRNQKNSKRPHMAFGPRNSPGNRDPAVKPVGIWMDTLCVPVKDDEARTQAIRKMRNIYEHADPVLVLDSWTQALPRSADIIEKAC